MFCNRCGNQLPDEAQFCNSCGAQAATPVEGQQPQQPYPQQPYQQQPYQPQPYQQQPYQPVYQAPAAEDVPNTGLNVLSFFFWIAGVIIYATSYQQTPNKAKAALKWSLIGVAFWVVFGLVIGIAMPLIFMSAMPY